MQAAGLGIRGFGLVLILGLFLVVVLMILPSITVSNASVVLPTVQEEYEHLQNAVDDPHFQRPKHQGESPDPETIKQTMLTGSCNPIKVFDCPGWEGVARTKFTCVISSETSIGIVIAIDPGLPQPLNITAFPSTILYWDTIGVAGCTFLGYLPHP
jgi:hypothetical protein